MQGMCARTSISRARLWRGVCAIAAYHQELMDELLKVDGENEFTLYWQQWGRSDPLHLEVSLFRKKHLSLGKTIASSTVWDLIHLMALCSYGV